MQEPANRLNSVLTLDAVYAACGLEAYTLKAHVNFTMWLKTRLGPLLTCRTQGDVAARVLKRRAVWLLGCWAESLPPTLDCFNLLTDIISDDLEDITVRLAAVDSFAIMVAHEQLFQAQEFVDSGLLRRSVRFCLRLLQKCETCLAQVNILQVITQVGNKLNPIGLFAPVASELLSTLPKLWSNADIRGDEDFSLVKGGILEMCSMILESNVLTMDPTYEQIVLSLLEYATNPDSKEYAYLREDGLRLWKLFSLRSIRYSRDLHVLFPRLKLMIEHDFSNLEDTMAIVDAYILLGGVDFVNEYAGMMERLNLDF